MSNIKVDVVIPVYKPDKELRELLQKLQKQTHPVNRVIIINTDKQYFSDDYCVMPNMEVVHITRDEFDHGATRNMGIELCQGEYVLLMTMDAIPENEYLVEELLKAHVNNRENSPVAVSYARQLPREDCRLMEEYTRIYNYPEESMVKTKADVSRLGIKAYFCSDVCAMYNKEIYMKLGGFVSKAIFNEDMIFAAQ